jgi:hypothetical protein
LRNSHEGTHFATPVAKRSRDVTKDIADELRRRYAEFAEVSDSILAFLEANRC